MNSLNQLKYKWLMDIDLIAKSWRP